MKQSLPSIGMLITGILIGGSLVHSTMSHTPVTDAVHKAGEALVEYHKAHGGFPPDLSQLPGIETLVIRKYGITFDPEARTLSTTAAGDYYETSFLYALTKGMVGRRFTYMNPGWDISERLE